MSKQISAGLALLALLSFGSSSFLPGSRAQTAATANAQNAAIVSTTAAMLKETSELRELSILKAVKSGAQSRADIERMIIKNLDSDTTPAEMHAAEVLLRIQPRGAACTITIQEDAVEGPGSLIPRPARQLAILPRNRETLRRLAYIAENRR